MRIMSPPELADMTLENRLVTYDWENQFKSFQDATRKGSFKPLCWMKKSTLLPVCMCVYVYVIMYVLTYLCMFVCMDVMCV